MKDKEPTSEMQQLRVRAEKRTAPIGKRNIAEMSTMDITLLLHELDTHQIELEMQNEDLRTAQFELVEMRDQYAELYDFAPIGYITLSKKGLILQSNLTFAAMLGAPRSKLVNQPLSPFIVEEDKDDYYRNLNRVIDTPGKHSCELRLRTQTNSSLWVRLDCLCVETADDACDRVRLIISDISQRKHAEAEQARLQRELQQAQKMEALGQLTGGIAHDFNNILGIIMGHSTLVRDRCISIGEEKLVERLKRVLLASKRAESMVAQLLSFTRSRASNDKPVQLQNLLREDLELLISTLPASIEISTEIAEGLPDVLMDTVQLNQLLMNLCINARDAMDREGHITISLGWAREVAEECATCRRRVTGDWVELSVSDTGSGIKRDVLERIFDPFYTTKEVGKGTGMGLSVIHGIMRSQGGHVLVETKLGKGTIFRLLFPPVVDETNETPVPEQSSVDLPHGHGAKVLVLDDELDLGEYLGDLLETYGYLATVMTNSTEALGLLKENPNMFDVVITDQTMPEITGLDLVKAMREIRPDMPVILNTGYSDDINAETAVEMGICYLEKPVTAKSLLQTINELIRPTKQSAE